MGFGGDESPFQQGLVAQWDSAGMNPLLSTWKSIEMDSASALGSVSMGVCGATGFGGWESPFHRGLVAQSDSAGD